MEGLFFDKGGVCPPKHSFVKQETKVGEKALKEWGRISLMHVGGGCGVPQV